MVKTLILRFRDLAISDTIGEHEKIIDEREYCWWGWWNKPQEKLPRDVLATLNTQAKGSGLEIYLFDSGKKYVYKAECVEIKFSTDESAINLGEAELEKIPEYYRTQKYLAWFKFKSITRIPDKEIEPLLNKFSYVHVGSFFAEYRNSFEVFSDKRICSTNELYFQQRTIWFIRDYKEGDKENEINLMSQSIVVPSNYDEFFTQLKSNTILWLSDLHFSEEYHVHGHSEIDDDDLFTIINQKIEKKVVTPSAIIISGDLTYKAQAKEFDDAEKFIKKMNSIYNIDSYNLAICPGNHDFSFSDDKSDLTIKKTTTVSSEEFRKFYKKIYNCEPSQYFCSIRRFLTKDLVPIEIINMNSVSLQQINIEDEKKETVHSFAGLGYVGKNQIAEIESKLKNTDNSNCIRILVLHHHIVPVLESEEPKIDTSYSLILDAGRVNRFIFDKKISLVLHGHSHKQSYYRLSKDPLFAGGFDCNIVGLGSAGVIPAKLTEGNPNMIALLNVNVNELLIQKIDISEHANDNDVICEHRFCIDKGKLL